MTETPDRHSRIGACPEPELLGAHAERRLVGEQAVWMDGHIASCPNCSQVFAEAIRSLDEQATARPAAPVAAAAAARPRFLLPAALAAAAALILALWSWQERPSAPQQTARTEGTPADAPGLATRSAEPRVVTEAEPSPPGPEVETRAPIRDRSAFSRKTLPDSLATPTGDKPEPQEARVTDPVVAQDQPAPPPGKPEVAPAEPPARTPPAAPAEPAEDEPLRRAEEVTIESASKVEQKLIDAPATMSVVTSEALAVQPAQNMADTLRSVPGLNVIQTSVRDFNMTARQATSTLSTSTLVSVDGRSVYLDFFGLVLWDFVPSPASGEIKQIEVVRGPASVVWGANAENGVMNIITKTPRENEGLGLVLAGGLLNRDGGSRQADGSGFLLDGAFSHGRALNDTWSYKLSAGYFHSDPFSRPVGTVPRDCHPLGVVPCRDAAQTPVAGGIPIGGAAYPADAAVPGGFENTGTSQPKAHLRVDQDFFDGGRLTYEGGFGGTRGIVHTGIGPFALQDGSYMAYGRVAYQKHALRLSAFANHVDADAPNLLVTDPDTLGPLLLAFKTQTYDLELGNTNVLGGRHILTYGANYRRNNFDITLAEGPDRNEFGAYGHWEYLVDRFLLSAGGRADKFGNIDGWILSPRLSAMFKPTPVHSIRASYNRAFTAPSFINNYMDQNIAYPTPIDLTPLAAAIPAVAPLVPPPFLLTVNVFGNPDLRAQSTDSFELAFTGTLGGKTTIGLAGYLADTDDSILFTYLVPTGTPGFPSPSFYSVANPARGVTLPTPTAPAAPITLSPALMGVLAAVPPPLGPILLPDKVATYLNLGPVRNRGIEASIDHRWNNEFTGFANYSWQATPRILGADSGQVPYPTNQLGLPPRHRFNVGLGYSGRTLFANANLNYASEGLWVDVLSANYAGFSDSYSMLNATLGVKLADGKLALSLKGTNLANQTIQQHVFGDILKRSVVFELRYFKK